MKKLEEINLSRNEIANIEDGVFDNLPELKILDLSENSIPEYVYYRCCTFQMLICYK